MLDAVDMDTSTHSALGMNPTNTLIGINRCMVFASRLIFTTQNASDTVIILCHQHI